MKGKNSEEVVYAGTNKKNSRALPLVLFPQKGRVAALCHLLALQRHIVSHPLRKGGGRTPPPFLKI